MILHRHAREQYALTITTSPATQPTDWSASFDGGATWSQATAVNGRSTWLLAGASADSTGAVAVLSRSVNPLVRLTANPEVVVRDAPRIQYV